MQMLFVSLFLWLLADMLSEDIMDRLARLINHIGKNGYDETLSHVALTASTNQLHLPIIDRLLLAEADPNGAYNNGNGALHHLAMRAKGENLIDSIARVLLDCGAYLDRVNKQGKTATDVWEEKNIQKKKIYRNVLFWRVSIGWHYNCWSIKILIYFHTIIQLTFNFDKNLCILLL